LGVTLIPQARLVLALEAAVLVVLVQMVTVLVQEVLAVMAEQVHQTQLLVGQQHFTLEAAEEHLGIQEVLHQVAEVAVVVVLEILLALALMEQQTLAEAEAVLHTQALVVMVVQVISL
jgi:hypothetical protein